MVVNWDGIGLRNGHWDLLVHFDNLSDWHGHVFDHMHRVGDRMWHLYRIGNGHFHGHRFGDTDLLGRKVVLADECAQVLELWPGMAQFMSIALVTAATVDSGLGHGTESSHANDTEYLQRMVETRLDGRRLRNHGAFDNGMLIPGAVHKKQKKMHTRETRLANSCESRFHKLKWNFSKIISH